MAESQLLTATAVMQAATDGNAPELRRLLRHHEWAANAELRTAKAVWPLHAAIFFSHEPCVALLLRHGANADAKDCTGRTALQAARTLKRDAVVALLEADATTRAARLARLDAEIDDAEAEGAGPAALTVWESVFFATSFLLFLLAAAVMFCVNNPQRAAEVIGETRHAALLRTPPFRAVLAWHARKVGAAEL